MSADRCPHDDKPWRCVPCCLAELRRSVPLLTRAVRVRDKGGQDGPRPGFASRPPINVAAFALLQDIKQAGGTDGLEATVNTVSDPNELYETRRLIRQYRSRAALVLHEALAPYPLLWPYIETTASGEEVTRNKPIGCPVTSEDGQCQGALMVHRDNDPASPNYGKAAVIRCQVDDEHEWAWAFGGWLRLGAMLRLDQAS